MLKGLKGAAELNGRIGVVEGAEDSATGRWMVNLSPRGDEAAKSIKVKAANLEAAKSELEEDWVDVAGSCLERDPICS
jgi:hypothetical protein